MKKDTSWGGESVVGHYQQKVILPNLTRLVAPKKGEVILDIGCGEGYFAKKFAGDGARVIGVDSSKRLITLAQKTAGKNEEYHAWSADELPSLKDASVDKITVILAAQNMDNLHSVFKECRRVLKPEGRLYMVMNHPAFRIPKASDWAWDEKTGAQYRRIDAYLTESKAKIEMHPSASLPAGRQGSRQVPGPGDYTLSFHRPLQFYFKLLKNAGLAVANLEEWLSDKKSEPGPRADAENRVRKEIPLFLFLEAVKI